MTHLQIRERFIQFFIEREHTHVPSSSLIPENDPSVLLTTAGMQQFKPYMINEKDVLKDFGNRKLCSIQKSFRTSDVDEVGDETHLTFFEMLGNFSIGDYFKREAITLAWEFLTTDLKLDPQSLFVTVFAGDEKTPPDIEAEKIWREIVGENLRIDKCGREENFWGPTGDFGPCGPCSEIIYRFPDGKEMELWNLVFMGMYRDESGTIRELEQKNIDTGMGLERLALVLQDQPSIFDTDLFLPLIDLGKNLAEVGPSSNDIRSLRILADHSRAAVFLAADGVIPSNTERGYVLRRIIRRAVRHGRKLDIRGVFLGQFAKKVIEMYGEVYPELRQNQAEIISTIESEEERFHKTVTRGLKELDKMLARSDQKNLTGADAFLLYDTFGFPLDLTEEIVKERGVAVDRRGFDEEMKKQQERARSAGEFKRKAMASLGNDVAKNHTAAHLLGEALRLAIDPTISQRGQDLTAERLRFDFNFSRKLTDDEIKKIENLVNLWIEKDATVIFTKTTYEEALAQGAQALFVEKYQLQDQVTLYTVQDQKTGEVFSKELCGGPHISHTAEIKKFRIIKQENIGRGLRRIYAEAV